MRFALLLAFLATTFPLRAQPPMPSPNSRVPHRVVVQDAFQVVLSHLGIHTHANFLLFQTGTTHVAALRTGSRVRRLVFVAHCRLPTDRAAFPPGFAWFSKDYGPVPGSGSIDKDPGWSVSAVSRLEGKDYVKISVPTRFANWLAGQPSEVRRQYLTKHNYSLEITWEEVMGSSR